MNILDKLFTDQRQKTPHLQYSVPANTTTWNRVLEYEVPADCTVEDLEVWHVPNSEDALRTRPLYRSSGTTKDLIDYPDDDAAEQYVTGEPDDRPYQTDVSLEQGDTIIIEAMNLNDTYDYRFVYTPKLDFFGGTDRYVGGLLGGGS